MLGDERGARVVWGERIGTLGHLAFVACILALIVASLLVPVDNLWPHSVDGAEGWLLLLAISTPISGIACLILRGLMVGD